MDYLPFTTFGHFLLKVLGLKNRRILCGKQSRVLTFQNGVVLPALNPIQPLGCSV